MARERAGRPRADPETGEPRMTRHGQPVGDRVELLAPVVFEPRRPSPRPPAGSLSLDDLPLSVREPAGGPFGSASGPSAPRAFSAGAPGSGVSRPSRTHLRPTGRRSWAPSGALRRESPATTTSGETGRWAPPSPRPSSSSASGTCATRSSGCWPRAARSLSSGPRSTRCCRGLRPPSAARRSGEPSFATPAPPTSHDLRAGLTARAASSRTGFGAGAGAAGEPPRCRSRPRRWTG